MTTHKVKIVHMLLVFFAALIVGLPSLQNGFVYDDEITVLSNYWIRSFSYLGEVFTSSSWGFVKEMEYSYYRPVFNVVFQVNYLLFELEPWGWHLVNMVFHGLNGICVLLLGTRLLGTTKVRSALKGEGVSWYPLLPLFAGLLFVTNPVVTEATVWVSGIQDLTFTFFYLLSLIFYMDSVKDGGTAFAGTSKESVAPVPATILPLPYLSSLIFFFLSLLSKEPAITLPLLIVAIDLAAGRTIFSLRAIVRYIPIALVVTLYFGLRSNALGGILSKAGPYDYLTVAENLMNVPVLFKDYVFTLLLPLNLNQFHLFTPVTSAGDPVFIGSLLVTVVALLLLLRLLSRRGIFIPLVLLLLLPVLPALYIGGLGLSPFGERYLYMSSVAFSILVAYGGGVLVVRYGARAGGPLLGAAVTVLLLYSLSNIVRTVEWKDNESLWNASVRKEPDNYYGHLWLGKIYNEKGEPGRAVTHYERSVELNKIRAHPDKRSLASGYFALGLLYYDGGRFNDAVEAYRGVIDIGPEGAVSRGDALTNLGNSYFGLRDYKSARSAYEEALKINPRDDFARHNLDTVLGILAGRGED